jgi:prevent-host-death family protein
VTQLTVGIRELKARLSGYLQQVKAGSTLVITDRGQPIGRIVPIKPSLETQMQELLQTGLVTWSGRLLIPREPVAKVQGQQTVADLLLENRE